MISSSNNDCSLISVIIPTYNVESFIKECIDSIEYQTYKNLEILLIDDGSTDNSGDICDEYALKNNRIKVIHKNNGGLSDARNVGIDLAQGDYIAFIDSDDFIYPEYFEYLYELISKNNADMSSCQPILVDESGNTMSTLITEKDHIEIVSGRENCMAEYVISNKINTTAWGNLYKTSLFKKSGIRYPVGKYHEDVFTTYRIIDLCEKIVVGNRKLYAYRQRGGSIINSGFSEKHLDGIYGSIQRFEFISSKYPRLKRVASAGLVYSANMCLLRIAHSNAPIKKYKNLLKPIFRKYSYNFIRTPNVSFMSKCTAFMASLNLNLACSLIRMIHR